jgi:hypothetical protein
VDAAAIKKARQLLLQAQAYFKSLVLDKHVAIIVGHQKTGAVTLDFTVVNHILSFIVYRSRVLVGRYSGGSLTEEFETRQLSPENTKLSNCFKWLLGV